MNSLEAPPGYRAERPTRADLSDIAEVLVACDIDEVGQPDFQDAQWLEEEWDLYPVDLETCAWVVRNAENRTAAYVHIAEEIPGRVWEAVGWVHPKARGEGLGSFLVRATEKDLTTKLSGAEHLNLHHIVSGADALALNLLGSAGFAPTRHFWHMQIDLGAHRPRPARPPELSIVPLRLQHDEVEVHRVLEAAFARHWGFAETPFDKWIEESVRKPWFDASLSFVARFKEEIAGALIGRIDHGRGFIDDLGVIETQRGRGIGAALLDESFSSFEQRGLSAARLNVDAGNETGAVRLYERLGMKTVRTWVVLAKQIGAEQGADPSV
ncbi:MAG: GNAT family N-acetyltransferase [Actinomycetota bacterium]|nr:GNAT family N-acetyltransferase [Actinomycetota bacterium]